MTRRTRRRPRLCDNIGTAREWDEAFARTGPTMQPDIGGGVSLIYAEVCVYIQPMPKGVRVHVSPAFGRELVAVRGSGETGDIGDSVVEFSTVRSRQRRHRMFVADRRKGGAQ